MGTAKTTTPTVISSAGRTPGRWPAVYRPEPREVLLEVDLPDTDVVLGERAWRYVAAHQRIDPLPRAEKDKARIYGDLISRIALAVMHACFAALDGDVADTITFNGHVRTIDPATGRPAHPCLVTVTAARATFAELQLDHEKLNPAECLRFLGAELSPHPYARTHVEPFVDFDLARYRLITAAEALVDLDPRADLLQMAPFEFERLVKELFVSMGYRAWRTQDRRDDAHRRRRGSGGPDHAGRVRDPGQALPQAGTAARSAGADGRHGRARHGHSWGPGHDVLAE